MAGETRAEILARLRADWSSKNVPTGAGASDLLLSADGYILTVGNWNANSISEIDTTDWTLIQTIPLGGPPIGVALVPIQ